MGFIVSIILLILAISCHKKTGCWYSPGALFCYMWSAITFFSSLHLYGMYQSSDKVYLIILVGTISFVLGVGGCKEGQRTKITYSPATQSFVSKHLFWFLLFVLLLLKIKPFIQSVALQMAGVDLQTIRLDVFEGGKTIKDLLIGVAVSVAGPIVEAMGIVYFLRDIRKNLFFFFAIMLIALMQSVIDGGRFGIAFVIVELGVGYSFFKDSDNSSFSDLKKYKRWIVFFVLLLVAAIVALTLLRGTEVDEIMKKYYRYFCGDVIFFDLHIPALEQGPLYPLGTGLWGFWSQFFPLMHSFGFDYPSWYLNAANSVMQTQDFFQIGDDLFTNAFSTPFYYLYADLRIVGVIVGMYVFGFYACYFYNHAKSDNSNKYIAIYLLVCQMIFMTIFFYPFTNTGYVLITLFLFLRKLFKKA